MIYNPCYQEMGKSGQATIDRMKLRRLEKRWISLIDKKEDGQEIPESLIDDAYKEMEKEEERIRNGNL